MTRYLDIVCPIVDERSLVQNVLIAMENPHDPAPRQQSTGEFRLDSDHADRVIPEGWPTLITARSPMSLRKRVEILARYFRREFGYDFVNFTAQPRDPKCEAWLWTTNQEGRMYATGHAVFWKQHFADRQEPEWELGSVWQHPYFRGEGRLSEVWPHWAASYGPFWVCRPWSPAMAAFMDKTPHRFPDGTSLP
jgi:hypothetical protein